MKNLHARPSLLLTTLLVVLVALSGAGCGADTDSTASATNVGGSDGASLDGASLDGAGADALGDTGTPGDAATSASTGATEPKIWAIGVTTLMTIGANGRSLPTEVWYPIEAGATGEAAKYMLGIIGSPYGAIRNAEAAKGPFHLIAFSHGNGGVREQSVYLTEYLARHGYVVVSPDHVGNTTLDIDNNLAAVMSLWRPLDVTAAIDRVMAPTDKDPAWLKGLVHTDKIGVTGHSFGGYTTLALAGIAIDLPSGATIDCATVVGKPVCDTRKNIGDAPWQLGDKRVAVAVPLAHALYDARALSHASAKKLKVPVIMMASTGDTLTPAVKEAEPLFADLTSPTALLTIQGGNHFSFANMCELGAVAPANIKATINQLCGPGAKPTMADTHAVIAEHALAAFDIWLRGDDSKRALFLNGKDGGGVYTMKSKGITK